MTHALSWIKLIFCTFYGFEISVFDISTFIAIPPPTDQGQRRVIWIILQMALIIIPKPNRQAITLTRLYVWRARRSYFGLTCSVCLSNCHRYHQHDHDCQHPVDYRSIKHKVLYLAKTRTAVLINKWTDGFLEKSLWAASRNDCMQFKSWKIESAKK